jgi:hypothetical protein
MYDYRHRIYHAPLGRFASRDPIGVKAGINLVEYVSASPMNRTDPQGLQAISEWNLRSLVPWLPACAAFVNGIWYQDFPANTKEEGTLFGAIWSDGGSCKNSSKWVHVRLFFSTRISDGTCAPKFEEEIVQYNPRFYWPDEKSPKDYGCTISDPGTIHRSLNWRDGDCSYVTWAWKCPVTCIKHGTGEICDTPAVSAVSAIRGFTYELRIRHSVNYSDERCCLSPCSAKLEFEQALFDPCR